jgi:prepilin-type processing-associated H-X9-DG protein
VLLVLSICVFAVLLLLIRMPRGREEARATACLSNLQQLGQALSLYVQMTGRFPTNPKWEPPHAAPSTSVFWALRSQADLWNFKNVRGEHEAKGKGRNGERPAVPSGLRCLSDRTMTPPTATNYRANAGYESTGETGPFRIGGSVTPSAVEAADGVSFTAAFSERLIGTGSDRASIADYLESEGCEVPTDVSLTGTRRTDAGHDWSRGDWVSTLYQHGLKPNAPDSWIGTKKTCGRMGASSGHSGTVNVMLLDGSARGWRESVDATVWQRLGGFEDSAEAGHE